MAGENKIRTKFLCAFAGLVLIGFIGFAIFKANRVAAVYDSGSHSIQFKIQEVATKIRSGELEISGERLAVLLETSADRTLEHGIMRWFKTYLILFILLFGVSTLFLLYREAVKEKS